MAFQKDQQVYFKNVPRLIYGTIVHIVDEGAEDPSVIVQPEPLRCHISDLEAAELPESPTDRAIRVLGGPLGQILEQWAVNPESAELQSKAFDLFRELGWIKKLPPKK